MSKSEHVKNWIGGKGAALEPSRMDCRFDEQLVQRPLERHHYFQTGLEASNANPLAWASTCIGKGKSLPPTESFRPTGTVFPSWCSPRLGLEGRSGACLWPTEQIVPKRTMRCHEHSKNSTESPSSKMAGYAFPAWHDPRGSFEGFSASLPRKHRDAGGTTHIGKTIEKHAEESMNNVRQESFPHPPPVPYRQSKGASKDVNVESCAGKGLENESIHEIHCRGRYLPDDYRCHETRAASTNERLRRDAGHINALEGDTSFSGAETSSSALEAYPIPFLEGEVKRAMEDRRVRLQNKRSMEHQQQRQEGPMFKCRHISYTSLPQQRVDASTDDRFRTGRSTLLGQHAQSATRDSDGPRPTKKRFQAEARPSQCWKQMCHLPPQHPAYSKSVSETSQQKPSAGDPLSAGGGVSVLTPDASASHSQLAQGQSAQPVPPQQLQLQRPLMKEISSEALPTAAISADALHIHPEGQLQEVTPVHQSQQPEAHLRQTQQLQRLEELRLNQQLLHLAQLQLQIVQHQLDDCHRHEANLESNSLRFRGDEGRTTVLECNPNSDGAETSSSARGRYLAKETYPIPVLEGQVKEAMEGQRMRLQNERRMKYQHQEGRPTFRSRHKCVEPMSQQQTNARAHGISSAAPSTPLRLRTLSANRDLDRSMCSKPRPSTRIRPSQGQSQMLHQPTRNLTHSKTIGEASQHQARTVDPGATGGCPSALVPTTPASSLEPAQAQSVQPVPPQRRQQHPLIGETSSASWFRPEDQSQEKAYVGHLQPLSEQLQGEQLQGEQLQLMQQLQQQAEQILQQEQANLQQQCNEDVKANKHILRLF